MPAQEGSGGAAGGRGSGRAGVRREGVRGLREPGTGAQLVAGG